jgi:uncharacterized membrane protein YheB (UPF0754 family)
MAIRKQICFKIHAPLRIKLDSYISDNSFESISDAMNHILTVYFLQGDFDQKIQNAMVDLLEEDEFKTFLNSMIDEEIQRRT